MKQVGKEAQAQIAGSAGAGGLPVSRRSFTLGLSATLALGTTRLSAQSGENPLLFAYFGTGDQQALGLKLALSEDGFTFRELADGRSFLPPQVGEAKLMRDPFIFRDAARNGLWHMVWTTAWEGRTIGHATSHDFRHWSQQQALPVMRGIEGVRNCWAPEVIWDARRRRYIIFWSSAVDGMFTDVAHVQGEKHNHRLWYATTRDFRRLSRPRILFNPGFSVIDGTFAPDADGQLFLIIKDETEKPAHKFLQVAKAASPTGPFGPLSQPFTGSWVEGPMTAQVGDRTICYFDKYIAKAWGAAATADFKTWQDVSAQLNMPQGARHGSLLRIPRSIAAGLEAGPVIT